MWGTRRRGRHRRLRLRFIPAYVGNTARISSTGPVSPVHPRVCGEHCGMPDGGPVVAGSSPRMWGTPFVEGAQIDELRFIPAYVGNTRTVCRQTVPATVHPRVCGEHTNAAEQIRIEAGSSPRMWGTRLQTCRPQYSTRFIPAYVGNTSSGRTAVRSPSVHPRVCGEHIPWPRSLVILSGSSPRMWGTQ